MLVRDVVEFPRGDDLLASHGGLILVLVCTAGSGKRGNGERGGAWLGYFGVPISGLTMDHEYRVHVQCWVLKVG